MIGAPSGRPDVTCSQPASTPRLGSARHSALPSVTQTKPATSTASAVGGPRPGGSGTAASGCDVVDSPDASGVTLSEPPPAARHTLPAASTTSSAAAPLAIVPVSVLARCWSRRGATSIDAERKGETGGLAVGLGSAVEMGTALLAVGRGTVARTAAAGSYSPRRGPESR
eukprot:COSAG04_NODE_1810_length_5515_cov_6.783419_3_plen_170_part_00